MDKEHVGPPAPPPPPDAPKSFVEKVEAALTPEPAPAAPKERVAGHTTIKAFETGSNKPLEITKMQDSGTTIEVWVKL